jgi:hypothetical protein
MTVSRLSLAVGRLVGAGSRWSSLALGAALMLGMWGAPLAGQETGTPVFHAPYRAFASYEFGVSASFLENSQTAFEGLYRLGVGPVDVGARLGGVVRKNAGDAFLAGVDARVPVLFHESGSPLDGSVVTGLGMTVGSEVGWWIPLGLSLARRLNLEGSDVSFVPYVQPAGFITTVGASAVDFGVGLGLGLDVRMTRAFEVRVSGGIGTTFTPRGLAVAAAWLR